MSTVDELRRAVYRYLEETGGLRKLEAQTEAEVFSALNNMASNGERKPSDPIHSENFLVNELILEYFKFNDLKFSEKTFRKEADHLSQPLSRRILCQTLNVRPTVSTKALAVNNTEDQERPATVEKPVPLLYYLVEYFKNLNLVNSDNRTCP
ncbi:hypothetical protein AAHC03_013766 [Spirometra sp. Aus1]